MTTTYTTNSGTRMITQEELDALQAERDKLQGQCDIVTHHLGYVIKPGKLKPAGMAALAEKEILELRAQRDAAAAILAEMKRHLATDGNYRICRKSGEGLNIGERVMLGDLFVRADKLLEKRKVDGE